ncbi:MAG TPA: PH domain-containing protein, partial [Anaerolineae bacterium]|nr:PH domain-containing protein [Anaerolineae bacterium]
LSDAHDVTAIANSPVTVLEIERKALDELMARDPALRHRLKPKHETAERMRAPHFGWQAPDETVIKFVREHSWALARRMFIPVGLLIGLIIGAAVLNSLSLLSALVDLILILAGLVILAIVFFVFIDWHDDFYVVTNKRVVHIDQIPLIRQKKEEAPLSTIQEIQFARNSIIAHLLNFGDLRVETFAGSVAMKDIPRPEEVKSLIFREIEKVRSRSRAAARRAIREELTQRVAKQIKPSTPPPPAAPESAPPATLRSYLAGIFRYFVPKLREVSGETVIYRKYWVALLRKSRLPFAGLVATLVAALVWWNRGPVIGLLPDSAWLVWVVLVVVFGAWALWRFEDWRNDLYIVTPTRIIDIQRIPFLLQETRKESGLDKIQTMEVKILTPWARLLQYGNVIIRVPGATYEFNDVHHPSEVQGEISKRIEQFKRRQAESEARGRRSELSDWFAMYDQLRTGFQPVAAPESSEQASDEHS